MTIEDIVLEISKEVSDRGLSLYFCIRNSRSMYPSLRDRDIVEVRQSDISDITLGDIIVYRNQDSGLVAHRVIGKKIINNRPVCITRGDNNQFYSEDYIYLKDIIGKVVSIKRDKQTIKLDNLADKLKTAFYIKVLNSFKWFYFIIFKGVKKQIRHGILGGLWRGVQGLNIYKYFAQKIVKDKIVYRIATSQDVPSLARLLKVWYQPISFQEATSYLYKVHEKLDNSGYCFIAQKGNRLIGTLTIRKSTGYSYGYDRGNFLRAETLYVDWRYRHAEVAEQLCNLAIKKFLEKPRSEPFFVKAMILKNNFRAINLIRKLGFYPIKKFSKKIIFIAKF